ncbi:hypothetical protein TW95_gp0073 [Pandoravirus inopinatum]|uniref:Uncharacterized protein n=1 Tax=Pandoravirus inopinatum TaxID=1605721 RepID=A0A0B5JB80_9VIRU|nr:hypothetical protein TW95_gp0073 [Pandoravirus inopinatum]AJF96807.1 hypothetical protein [Pandoravirus inopinatum]
MASFLLAFFSYFFTCLHEQFCMPFFVGRWLVCVGGGLRRLGPVAAFFLKFGWPLSSSGCRRPLFGVRLSFVLFFPTRARGHRQRKKRESAKKMTGPRCKTLFSFVPHAGVDLFLFFLVVGRGQKKNQRKKQCNGAKHLRWGRL